MLLDYRTAWTKAKIAWAKTTSVLSSMLKIVSPQWSKAETTWDGWTVTKRGIALGILAVGALFAWKFSLDITRLVSGSYRSAHAYGYGQNVSRSDLSGMAHMSDISAIQRQIDDLKSELASIDDKFDKAQAQSSRITTGSLPKKKKPAPVKASQSYRLVLP